MQRYRRIRRCWRRLAPLLIVCFAESALLTPVAQAQALAPPPAPGHLRPLTPAEMRHITGAQGNFLMNTPPGTIPPLATPVEQDAGTPLPWEGSSAGTNTVNGNKLTDLPLVGWTARGGLPVGFTLHHNSQAVYNGELGPRWTHSYSIYLALDTLTGNPSVHWGNGLTYAFTRNLDGSYTPPTGIYDTLVAVGSPITRYDLTTKEQVTYRFTNPNGTGWFCTSIVDPNGNTVTINRSTSNRVTTVVDPTSRTLTLGYDTNGKLTSVTDPQSRVWTISYTSGRVSSVTWPLLNSTSYSVQCGYDTSNRLTTLTDRRGYSWTFSYNTNGSLAWEKDPYLNQTSYSYTSTQTTVTDPNSHTLKHNYDTSGRLTSEVDALNLSESYGYNTSNQRTSVTDRRGKLWQYTFDSRGNVLTATDPLNHTTTLTYNSKNKPLTVTDALDHTTTFTYDTNGNCLTETDALDHTTTHTYGDYGLRQNTTDALDHTTQFTYTTHGDLDTVTDPNSNSVSFTYNTLGVKTSAADGEDVTTTYTLDAWNRVTGVEKAGTTLATTTYDAEDHVLTVTDGNSYTTTNVYDNAGRLTSTTNGRDDVVTYTWDGTGQKGLLSAKTNGNNRTTTYTYTVRNEKASAAYPDSTGESWTYDNAGNPLTHTDGKGQTITRVYDDAGRLTGIDYPTGTDTGFSYDAANRRTGMTDGTGTTTWNYDNANRLTSLVTPNGTVSYDYDDANRRTQMTKTGLGSWTYGYDSGNRLTSVTNPYNETTAISYNAANLPTTQTNGNTSVTEFGYDALQRQDDVWHKTSGGVTLGRYQYVYDAASNVTSRTDNDGSVTTFGYDGANQLASETRTGAGSYTLSYTYDANGNRLTKVLNGVTESYTYDWNDRLQTAGTKSYGYDNNGNCTSVTSGGQTTTLAYSYDNRLVQISYPGGATNTFAYNGLGLRTQKVDSTGTRNYVCDGAEVASPVLQDGAATYTPGLSERRGTTSKFYHPDALGSTRGITSSAQAATDSVLYDGFGMVVSRTGTTPTPFGFVGAAQYQSDPDSGLLLLGHRYYDPSTGRFLTRDPIQDGDNWYAYCENNPLAGVDPAGLENVISFTVGGALSLFHWAAWGDIGLAFDPSSSVLAVTGHIGGAGPGKTYGLGISGGPSLGWNKTQRIPMGYTNDNGYVIGFFFGAGPGISVQYNEDPENPLKTDPNISGWLPFIPVPKWLGGAMPTIGIAVYNGPQLGFTFGFLGLMGNKPQEPQPINFGKGVIHRGPGRTPIYE